MDNCLPKARTQQEEFNKKYTLFEWINSRAFFAENWLYRLNTAIEGWLSAFFWSVYQWMWIVRDILTPKLIDDIFKEVWDETNVYSIAKSNYKIDIDSELFSAIYPNKVVPQDAIVRRIEVEKIKTKLSDARSKEYKQYINTLANWTQEQKLAFAFNYVQTANTIKKNTLQSLEALKWFAPQHADRFNWMIEAINDGHIKFWTKWEKNIDAILNTYNWIWYIEYHWWKFFEWAWDSAFFSSFSTWRRWTDWMVSNIKAWYSKEGSINKWNTWIWREIIDRLANIWTKIFKASRWVNSISYLAMAAQWIQATARLKLIEVNWWQVADRIKQRLPESRLISQNVAWDINDKIAAWNTLFQNGIIADTNERIKNTYRWTLWSVQTPQDLVDVVAEESILTLWSQRAVQEMYWTAENFIYRFDNWLISDIEKAETLRLSQLYANEERWIMRHVTLNWTEQTPLSVWLKAFNFRWFFALNKLRTFLKYTAFNVLDNWIKEAIKDPNLWQYLYWTAAQIKTMWMLSSREDDNRDETLVEELGRMLWYSDSFSFISGSSPWRIITTAIWEAFDLNEMSGIKIARAVSKEFVQWFKWYRQISWLFNEGSVRNELLWTIETPMHQSKNMFMYWFKDDGYQKATDITMLNQWFKNQWQRGTLLTSIQSNELYRFLSLAKSAASTKSNEYILDEERASIIQNSTWFVWTEFAKSANDWDWRWMKNSLSIEEQVKMRKYIFSLFWKNNIWWDLKAWWDVSTERWEALEDATIYKWNSLSDAEAQKRTNIGVDPEYIVTGDYSTALRKIASINDKDVSVKAKATRWLSAEWAWAWEIKLKALQEVMIYRTRSWSSEMFDPNIWDVVPVSVIWQRYWFPLTSKWKPRKNVTSNSQFSFDKQDDWSWKLINKAWTLWIEYSHAIQDNILENIMPFAKTANVQKFSNILAAWAAINDPSLRQLINFDWEKVMINNIPAKKEIDKILLASIVARDKPELAIEIYKSNMPSLYIKPNDDLLSVTQKTAWFAKYFEERAKIGSMYNEKPEVMIANTLMFAATADAQVIKNIYDNREELRKISPNLVSAFEQSMSTLKWEWNNMTEYIQNYLTWYEWMKNNVNTSTWKSGGKWKSIKIGKIKFDIDEIKQAQTKLGNLQFTSQNVTRQPVFTFKPRETKQIISNSWWDKATSVSYDTSKRNSNAKVAFSFPSAWRRKSKWNKKLGIWVFKR